MAWRWRGWPLSSASGSETTIPQQTPQDSSPGAWLTLAVTLAIQAMVAVASITLPVMAPVAAPALGFSPSSTGLYIAVVFVGAMLASLAAGATVHKYGAIRVSQFALLLTAAGLALCCVRAWPATAVGALLIGLGYGPVTPASSHLLARTTPAHRMSLVFSIKQTGVPVGGLLAGALVPSLLLLVGWQGSLLCVAAACLVCAACAQPLREALDADRDALSPLALGHLARPVRLVLSHRPLVVLAACSFVFSIAQSSLTTYLVTFLHEGFAWSLVVAGLALAVAQAGGIAGRILWGWVADRWMGATPMLAALAFAMTACAFATAMLGAAVPAALVLCVLFVFGASAIGWNGVYLAEVARRAPAGFASQATGGTLAFTFMGVVLGPPLFGALAGHWGSYRGSFALLGLLTASCFIVLVRTTHGPR